ncbi:hypothetical protein [Mesorhizobium sp. BE184]|uniref:hypothetical protein n=1 Tax=Mesorhizobium sp. BE184 TaxID=2817714 RepID=UPI002855B6CD|nr:hypothetical protein [Mesorhizobium sp. BE184]MDR7033030.1 hypothetical protein [Mesorhizobium sp. BE184]
MTTFQKETLAVLISGATHVLDRNGKEAYVYLARDGGSHMRLEDGETRSGRWQLSHRGYTAEWDTGAIGRWMLEQGAGGGIDYVNLDTSARIRMIGILFGNPKNLPVQS